MGKKNLFFGTPSSPTYKKDKKVLDRYGVEGQRMGGRAVEMTGQSYRSADDVSKDLAKAAMNDYDTRRTMEAQAMAGKKKAQKYAENGFKNTKDVMKANNMFERWHKKTGNGGDFSSNSDFAGLTHNSVQRERDKFSRDLATVDDLNALRDDLEQQEEATNKQPGPMEKSDALARAEDRLSEAEGYSAGSIYENNNRPAATDNTTADVTKSFLYDYKNKVREENGPFSNTEREISNAAKALQDPFGR